MDRMSESKVHTQDGSCLYNFLGRSMKALSWLDVFVSTIIYTQGFPFANAQAIEQERAKGESWKSPLLIQSYRRAEINL